MWFAKMLMLIWHRVIFSSGKFKVYTNKPQPISELKTEIEHVIIEIELPDLENLIKRVIC